MKEVKKAPVKKTVAKTVTKAKKPASKKEVKVIPVETKQQATVPTPVPIVKRQEPKVSKVVFTAPKPVVRTDKSRREFGKSFEVGARVKVLKTVDRQPDCTVMKGVIKSLTTVGAYVYDPEKDRSGNAPEWFPFFSPKSRLVLN